MGSFTIVDGKIVDGADVGNNFFLLPSDIGRPRAQAACELLRELNEGDVTGAFIHEVRAVTAAAGVGAAIG